MFEAPFDDLVRLFRKTLKTLKLLSLGIIAVAAVILALEVAHVYTMLAAIQPWLGVGFLLLLAVGLAALLGPPIVRYVRTPVVLPPPAMPADGETLTIEHTTARVDHLAQYLQHLERNPRLAGSTQAVIDASAACDELKRRATRLADDAAPQMLADIAAFERERVEPLLVPLDQEVERVIRQQALAVGATTAVSPYGTVDAFIVLWRNANLVSRIANLYFGRPGVRHTWTILRDVSTATVAALYMQPASSAAGGLIKNMAGRTAGLIAGPLLDGGANALFTLRLGYVAKARCRCFEAWTDTTRMQAVRDAFAVAGRVARGVFSDLATTVGSTAAEWSGRLGTAGRDTFAVLWRLLAGAEPEAAAEQQGS